MNGIVGYSVDYLVGYSREVMSEWRIDLLTSKHSRDSTDAGGRISFCTVIPGELFDYSWYMELPDDNWGA